MGLLTKSTAKLFCAVLAIAIAGAGCTKKEEQPAQMPSPHGMMGEPHQAVVVIPDSVKGKWKAVKVGVFDRTTKKTADYVIPIGSQVAVSGTDLAIKVENFVPDFIMDGAVRTSASNEPKKPAAQVRITEGGQEIYKSWLFYNLKSPHDFQHPKYSVSLVGFVPAEK